MPCFSRGHIWSENWFATLQEAQFSCKPHFTLRKHQQSLHQTQKLRRCFFFFKRTSPPEYSLRHKMHFSRFSGRSTIRYSDRHIVAILCSFGQFCNYLIQLIHLMYTSSSCSISSTSTNWTTCSSWTISSTLSSIIQMTSISCHSLYFYVTLLRPLFDISCNRTWLISAQSLSIFVLVLDSSIHNICQHLYLNWTLPSPMIVSRSSCTWLFCPQAIIDEGRLHYVQSMSNQVNLS